MVRPPPHPPGLVLALLLLAPAAAGAEDFDPDNTEWNGLSELAGLVPAGGLEVANAPSLPAAGGGLVWIHPAAGADVEGLRAFVRAGGRAVIADDFGSSGPLFGAFGLTLGDVDTAGLERLGGNPALPVARADAGWPLAQGVSQVVTNHPAGVSGPGEVRLRFDGSKAALAIEQRLGRGRILFLSDPGVLINNMLELDGNRRFARNLLAFVGESGAIRLHVGPLPGRAGDGAGGEDASGGWLGELAPQEELEALRDHLPWLLLVAFGLAVIGLAFLVPAGGERAWGGRAPGPPPARPVRVAVRAAALAGLPDHADGRLLASLVGRRARAALAAEGLTMADAYARLAPRADTLPRGLSGIAALLQQLQETPAADDPYAPTGRRWTVAEALALDEGMSELMAGIRGGGRRAA